MKKRILVPIVAIVLFSSCGRTPLIVPSTGVIKNDRIEESSSSSDRPDDEGSSIETKYSTKDVVGCLGEMLLGIPVKIVVDGFGDVLAGNKVDVNFSKKLIGSVTSEIDKYVLRYGRISPDHFFEALSNRTISQFELEMVNAYAHENKESFLVKKQMMAYAFLYFLERGAEIGSSYRFTFDGRDELAGYHREVISFNGSDLREKAEEAGSCAYFRFTDVELPNIDKNEILCTNDDLDKIRIVNIDNGLKLTMIQKNKKKTYTLDNFTVEEDRFRYKIKHNEGFFDYPEISLKIDKRSQYNENDISYLSNTADELDLAIKTGFFDDDFKLRNLNCREYGDVKLNI